MDSTYTNGVYVCLLNRKRQHSGGDEESGHLVPQAKRQNRAHPLSPEPGRDAWDSEVHQVSRHK